MSGQRVAVLGLGRMGAAMACRLRGEGWEVLGWHRSGAPVEGVTVEADLGTAVAQAGFVLVSLFDDAACTEVLTRARPDIPPGTPVVNTTTTSPDAATSFAGMFGSAYLHAPVLGSIPAVAGGTLVILARGDPDTITQVTPLLHALGRTIHVGQPRVAAASKLVSNGAHAGVLNTLRAALRRANLIGLDRSVAIEVLQHGPVGGLVRAKWDRLADPAIARPAEFTVAALAKDQALLAAASPHPWPLARETESAIASGAVAAEADIAALAVAAFEDEMRDRFGPIPESVAQLLRHAGLRTLCFEAGILNLEVGKKAIAATPRSPPSAEAIEVVRTADIRPEWRGGRFILHHESADPGERADLALALLEQLLSRS